MTEEKSTEALREELRGKILDKLLKIRDKYGEEKESESHHLGGVYRSYPIHMLGKDIKWEVFEVAIHFLIQNEVFLWIRLMLAAKFLEEKLGDVAKAVNLPDDAKDDEVVELSLRPFNAAVARHMIEWCRDIVKQGSLPFDLPPSIPITPMWSQVAVRNLRRKMEDRHVLIPRLDLLFDTSIQGVKDCSFFAVFDGHAGDECAKYAANHLLPNFVSSPFFQTDITAALEQAFADTDERFCKIYADDQSICSGCTAVVGVVRDWKLHVAWAGDSQVGLCRDNLEVEMLTRPHTLKNESEYKRVEEAGGVLIPIQGEQRINGVLNVCRSLGDAPLKPIVCSTPEQKVIELTGSELFMILACDGMWDYIGTEECVEVMREYVFSHTPQEFGHIARVFSEKAKGNNSSDNISVVFVYLKPPQEVWRAFGAPERAEGEEAAAAVESPGRQGE